VIPLPPPVRRSPPVRASAHGPDEITALHSAAAEWYAQHGYPIEAIHHAQAAENWSLAARLLSDHWFGLYLDGQPATAYQLLVAFPAGPVAADAELTALLAADDLSEGKLQEAARHLWLATRGSGSVPGDRRARFQVMLTVLRLQLARQRNDLPALAEEAKGLLAAADAPETAPLELGEDLRALALINLVSAERRTARFEDADRHLDQGIALAHRIERPYLELTGLAHGTLLAISHSNVRAARRAMQAVALAERHGWGEEPIVGVAYLMLGGTLVGQGRLAEAERWLGRAERTLRAEVEPAATATLHHFRGVRELASGRYQEALGAFRTAERLAAALSHRFECDSSRGGAHAGEAGRAGRRRRNPRRAGRTGARERRHARRVGGDAAYSG
jgi:LuxR family transcriptional regulator, maltose regulon positive regulatory protein